MPVSEATYRQVALEDHEGQWDLFCGRLRQKPPMTMEHQRVARRIHRRLVMQLNERDFVVGETVKVRTTTGSCVIPDVTVVPAAFERQLGEIPGTFEVYEEPLPLVVEVWSPPTGDYNETLYRGGTAQPAALPGVTVDLDTLFE